MILYTYNGVISTSIDLYKFLYSVDKIDVFHNHEPFTLHYEPSLVVFPQKPLHRLLLPLLIHQPLAASCLSLTSLSFADAMVIYYLFVLSASCSARY